MVRCFLQGNTQYFIWTLVLPMRWSIKKRLVQPCFFRSVVAHLVGVVVVAAGGRWGSRSGRSSSTMAWTARLHHGACSCLQALVRMRMYSGRACKHLTPVKFLEWYISLKVSRWGSVRLEERACSCSSPVALPVLIAVEVGGGEVRGAAGGEGLKLQC